MKRYPPESRDQLRTHLTDVLDAFNCAHRLATCSRLTPYDGTRKIWASEPEIVIPDPIREMPELTT